MNAKEYLGQAYWLDKRINNKLSLVMSLREMTTRTTGIMSGDVVSHTRNVHSMQDAISKLVDLENDINADIDRLADLKHDIIGIIGQVREPACQVVLEYRYLCYNSWEEIADKMQMHIRSVFRLHGRGMKAVEVILKKKGEVVSDCQ